MLGAGGDEAGRGGGGGNGERQGPAICALAREKHRQRRPIILTIKVLHTVEALLTDTLLTLSVPTVTNINFLLPISACYQEKWLRELIK